MNVERTETTRFADTVHVLQKRPEWGFSFGALRLNGDISSDDVTKIENVSPAAQVYVKKYLFHSLALRGNFFYSKFSDEDRNYTEPVEWREERDFKTKGFVSELAARLEWDVLGKWRFRHRDTVVYKLDKYTEYAIVEKKRFFPFPYVFAGAGGTLYHADPTYDYYEGLSLLAPAVAKDRINNKSSHIDFVWSAGGGLNFDLTKKLVLNMELSTHSPGSDYLDGISISGNPDKPDWWWYAGVGFGFRFGPNDKDADGVPDKLDKCPSIPGSALTVGCPDADKDGIEDRFDDCPHKKGVRALAGCPLKDEDNDGVPDVDDQCVKVPGLPQFNGCPDTDGDGVEDRQDSCLTIIGLPQFAGCPDTDLDGVEDRQDSCKTIAGLPQFNGCPDTDEDGIPDSKDACPAEAGPAEYYYGCPVRDTDNDGVEDKLDACLLIAGKVEFNGCPDTDGDGVDDRKDVCPTVAGKIENKGCPDVEKKDRQKLELAVKAVKFETGKAILKTESNKILGDIADIMQRYPYYSLSVEGHTDNQGKDETNQILSEKRAQACVEFLVGKGVAKDRLSSKGLGETKPVADNKTAAGRAANRRVEFELVLPEKN
ncbi:MAG: OmpA family protein [Saprospiraceae bacterium]|nr:OmpA family protein [Saprospiraceae bacterium]